MEIPPGIWQEIKVVKTMKDILPGTWQEVGANKTYCREYVIRLKAI